MTDLADIDDLYWEDFNKVNIFNEIGVMTYFQT